MSAESVRRYDFERSDDHLYVPAQPVREHLNRLKTDESVTWVSIARTAGVSPTVVFTLMRNNWRTVLERNARPLLELSPEDFPPFEIDPVVVDRIRTGKPYEYALNEKMPYARHMHAEYGWTASQLAVRMNLSWTRAREAARDE